MTTVAHRPEAGCKVGVEQWIRMYRQMVSIRLFEEQVNELYTRALMPGLAHLYAGEEAVAVGICEALRRDDYITSTHRGHGHCLAKGASPDRMFAELLGKEAGYCRGKGGSMHIADPATGHLGANAIVARGAAFGLHAESVEGQDVRAVHDPATRLVERARQGQGPAFLCCNTYRYSGHHVGDINREYYRSKQEEQRWKTERDPIKLLADWLSEQKLADSSLFDSIHSQVKSEMEKAVKFAISVPYPSPEEVEQDVYA